MGQQQSTGVPLKETERDLHWILNENVKWTERSSAAKLLLDGRPLNPNMSLDQQNTHVLHEVDLILAEGAGSTAIQNKPSLTQQLRSGSNSAGGSTSIGFNQHTPSNSHSHNHFGSGSNTDIFDMEKPIELPLSHPAHQYQASQTFGVAATKEILLARSTHTAQLGGEIQDWTRRGIDNGIVRQNTRRSLLDINDLASLEDADHAVLAGNPHESLPTAQTLAGGYREDDHKSTVNYDTVSQQPSGAGLSGLPTSSSSTLLSGGVSETEAASATKERIELATKYLYITTLLEKMSASAQLSYQMSLQMESLRKRMKPKRTRGLTQEAVDQLQAQFQQKGRTLADSRELFLKSRLTLQWFYRDFALNYGLHLLADAEQITLAEKERYAPTRTNEAGVVHSFGSGLPTAHEQATLQMFDHTLAGIESRRTALELRLMANERYALSIAHYYLSQHSSGNGLSMQDAPDLDPTFFHLLDVSHTQVVTREQLHVGIHHLAETLDSLNARIRALQMHNETMADGGATGGQNQNVITSNATKITRLQGEVAHARTQLQQLYAFFLQTFVRNIFVNLDSADLNGSGARLEAESIDAKGLRSDIGAISSSSKAVNPLDLANAGVVGPDEVVRQENVGTGLAVDREATSIEDQPQMRMLRETGMLPPPTGFGSEFEFTGIPQTASGTMVTIAAAAHQAWSPAQAPMSHLQSLVAKARKPLPAPPTPKKMADAGGDDVPTNAALALKLHASELEQQHEALHHVSSAEVSESDFGGQHPLNARVYDTVVPTDPIVNTASPTSAKRTLAAIITAPPAAAGPVTIAEQMRVLSPITEVTTPLPTPMVANSEQMTEPTMETIQEGSSSMPIAQPFEYKPLELAARNASLAAFVHPAELKAADHSLDHPQGIVETRTGSVHDAQAPLATPPHWKDLRERHAQLNHVSLKKAQLTPSGGIHTLSKQVVRIVPDAIYSAKEPEAATNSGLARVVQADHLRSVKLAKLPADATEDSSFGGRHDRKADLGGFVDPVALENERQVLDHIPTEYQRETMSGGLHMNDQSAALHPSLLDRVKHFVGLDTSLDKTAPELGHVVDARHPAGEQIARRTPSPMRGPAGLPVALPAPIEEPTATNATISRLPLATPPAPMLAEVAVQPPMQQQEIADSTAPNVSDVYTHAALAPVVSDSQLMLQRREMHHVDVARVELKRDLAASVGAVTTRRASISRRPSQATLDLAGVDAAPAVPSPRLPLVHGRSGSTSAVGSNQPSPRPSPSLALAPSPRQSLVLDPSKEHLPTLFDFEKHTPTLLEADKTKRFDTFLAAEKNIDIPRPMHESMPMQ